MIKTSAPKREQLPVFDPVTGTQIGVRPEPIERWIHRGWVAAREAEPKPLEEVIAIDIDTRGELARELPYGRADVVLGPRPKIFGMDIVTDPGVDGYEIRTNTLADWAEARARRIREERGL